MYSVKEIYYTLQGEGAHAGRPAVFCRFSGCNLWTGREKDREKAICQFCDTDFVGTDGPGGGRFADAAALVATIQEHWTGVGGTPYVVCTGGEPLLQLDSALIQALQVAGLEVAIESNGTIAAPNELDWICISPKEGSAMVQETGNELKLVFPQPGFPPEMFENWAFEHLLLQPMDGPDIVANTRNAIQYCMDHPKWRLSVQTHKYIGID